MCSSCCATYYGKTSRNLMIHCLEHLGINKSGCKINTPISSAIHEHIRNTGHNGSLDDFKIISKESTPWTSSFLKAFLFLRIGPLSIPNSLPFLWFSFSVHFFTVLSTHRFNPLLPMSPDYRCLLVYSAFFGPLFSFPLFYVYCILCNHLVLFLTPVYFPLFY